MEILITLSTAIIVNLLTEISKKININPRYIALGFSLIIGLLWYLYQTYIPTAIQMNITALVLGTATGAVSIYEFITRDFTKHE